VKIKANTACDVGYKETVISCFLIARRWSNDARK